MMIKRSRICKTLHLLRQEGARRPVVVVVVAA
jgi:hypothetical protein